MRLQILHYRFYTTAFFLFYIVLSKAQQPPTIVIHFNEKNTYQTIKNFGASDAWACQFVGSWPDEKKCKMADWLFSMDTLSNGNPKGIGLSLWRFNLGAGSAAQGDSSSIRDEWRRAALTTDKNSIAHKKVEAQNWFLQAAKQRGVQQFLGFFNSPPVQLTKNGKAFADKGNCNIDSIHYKAFADYTVKAIQAVKKSTGITFNYISPVNEPQWDWSDGGQEGCPYTNVEISNVVKAFSKAFQQHKLNTKLLITESGQLKYLLPADDKKDKDNQVHDFFNPIAPAYIGNLPNVSRTIASHSYFTTSPFAEAIALRMQVKDSVAQIKKLDFWQSEYCILGDNAGEINGNKKDLGMNAALYVAKVIYEDLVAANASAWQWWTAISAYDYKDGLIYIDKSKTGGNFSDSKMLWAMGNYSRFIRPGMKRIAADFTPVKEVYVSGFISKDKKQLVWVLVNAGNTAQTVSFDDADVSHQHRRMVLYKTDSSENLGKHATVATQLQLPAQSVITVTMQ
ncbi:xylanase [Ilyomonas limi]|uniref:Xylanase n=1 Tax=Ilyomonas limi TaxID=2575867 RepID=A0A4U3KSN6_9BACT|nr:glycoside hydrolase [Ilyomonas limi]TKK65312.1 xylanase [Ilyomonas limi]